MKNKKAKAKKYFYHPGSPPVAPKEFLPPGKILIGSANQEDRDIVIPPGAECLTLLSGEYDHDIGAYTHNINFYKLEEARPNPNYSIEMGSYLRKKKKYDKDLKEWNEYREQERLRVEKEQEKKEIEQYKKLKAKYGDKV